MKKPVKKTERDSHLDAPLGASEAQSESYKRYDERALELATTRSAKSAGKVLGFAKKNASAVRRPFAVFDIDGTLIRWQLYHAIADALGRRGLISKADYKAIKNARMSWKRREHNASFDQYQEQLIKIYEGMITKIKVADFERAVDEIFSEHRDQVYAYTRGLIADLKSQGYLLFAISASQIEIVAKIAEYYGFNDWEGSVYERRSGKFTGKRSLPIGKKDLLLKKIAKKHGAGFKNSLAVGDSASDISMLELVETPIAFNPAKDLFNYAIKNGWQIVVERKNVIYQLESKRNEYILAKTRT